MEIKPSIFIGSSKEGLAVARLIGTALESEAEIKLWTNAFDIGKSNFDNLAGQIAFYDYAILVATGDDMIRSRHKTAKGARDNVLFEFGLFAGGLGRSRVFYVMENGIKLPSDLAGIGLPVLPLQSSPLFQEEFDKIIARIQEHIAGKERTFDLGFLPSTAIAYGYFTNFVERTVRRLLEDKAEGKIFHLQNNTTFTIKTLRFTVLIPDDLADDMFNKVRSKRLKHGWQSMKVDPKDVRDYDFSVDISKAADGELHLVDIPLTLNALNKSIELYANRQHIGKNARESLLEQREVRNFKRTLEYLIQSASLTKDIVQVEVVSI